MKLVIQRLIISLLAIFVVCSFSFFLIYLVPGDPVDLILGDQASVFDKAQIKKNLGLDQNLWQQYIKFILNLLKGDLSVSLYSGRSVISELGHALPVTFQLAVFSLLGAILWGIPAGVFSALKKRWLDTGLSVISLFFMSFPVFFIAPILIWVFSLKLAWFPVSEKGDSIRYFILPCVSLALPLGAVLLKMSRAALLEVMSKQYIQTAQAKGFSYIYVGLKHGFKNALIPIVTVIGLQSGALLTGTVIIESIFDWPGLGLLLLEAIQRRDYPVVQGAVLLISVIYVLVNLVIDLTYIIIHPKMRET